MQTSELDRRLREIQLSLLPDSEPAPPLRSMAPVGVESPSAPGAAGVSVIAGPFDRIAAVRAFTAALAGLPEVAGVELRGYEAADRAVLGVRLR